MLPPPLLVRASAGTGKTYRLAGRLLHLLFMNADPASILATTFTRKAAGEILQRILVSLARAASDSKSLEDLRSQIQLHEITHNQCLTLLQQLMREIHRLRICTLDSLFSQLARCFPVELQLPHGWRLTDEIEETWLRRRAIDLMLAAIEPRELETLISMLHKGEAIRSIDSELQAIILSGYSESRWCDIDAWKSLHVPKPPSNDQRVWAANVLASTDFKHKSINKHLSSVAEELESNQLDAILEKRLIVQAGMHTQGDPPVTYYSRELSDEVIRALQVCFQCARSHTLGLLDLQTVATGELLLHYQHHIDSLKHQVRAYSFDDIAFRLASWVQTIDFQELTNRMDADLRHILLDEFQDTAPVQWAVLRSLSLRTQTPQADSDQDAEPKPIGTFFCVGDTKQAIYSWRGGRAAIFDAVTDELPMVQQDQQNKSFRSSPVIMDFVNRIFRNLSNHPSLGHAESSEGIKAAFETEALRKFESDFPIHESAIPDLSGYVSLKTTSAEVTSEEIAKEIASIANASPNHSVGVLTRTNSAVANLIYPLKRMGIDVSQEGGNPLTDSPMIELVLSSLMLAEHPSDLRWAYHVSHSPLSSCLSLPELAPAVGQEWEAQLQRVSAASDSIRRRLDYRGLANTIRWLADPLIGSSSKTDALRLRQLLLLAHSYAQAPQNRISQFVELVRNKRVQQPRPAQVRVMTVHQSKGLEFDTVVLTELDKNLTRAGSHVISQSDSPSSPPTAMLRYINSKQWELLPTSWQKAFGSTAAASLTEALCLLYVAVTRPRRALHMLIKPASNAKFSLRTPASLLYHALDIDLDPSISSLQLFASGEPDWFRR